MGIHRKDKCERSAPGVDIAKSTLQLLITEAKRLVCNYPKLYVFWKSNFIHDGVLSPKHSFEPFACFWIRRHPASDFYCWTWYYLGNFQFFLKILPLRSYLACFSQVSFKTKLFIIHESWVLEKLFSKSSSKIRSDNSEEKKKNNTAHLQLFLKASVAVSQYNGCCIWFFSIFSFSFLTFEVGLSEGWPRWRWLMAY